MKKKRKWICILVLLMIFLLGVIYLVQENRNLKVTRYTIESEKITEEFNDFRIVQISDFHNTRIKSLRNKIIRELEDITPDVIVITGDIIDAYQTNIDISFDFLKEIKDVAPIYFVTGNHEKKSGKYSILRDKLSVMGIHVLENKMDVIERNGSVIQILGINDPALANEFGVDDSTIADTEIKNISYDKSKYSILLSHRPELFNCYQANELDLVFAGHAHGGQVRLPWIGGVVAPNQGLFPKYDSGMYSKETTNMIVSRGIGNSILPFRINNNPELIYVTLRAQ